MIEEELEKLIKNFEERLKEPRKDKKVEAHICSGGIIRPWRGIFCSMHRGDVPVVEVDMTLEEIKKHNERVRNENNHSGKQNNN